jgi:hypothetical protein
LLTRTGTGGAGLLYSFVTNDLGYVWNGNSEGWDSGLNVPSNTWSFVALVIDPLKATLHVFNTNGYAASIHSVLNSAEAWAGSAEIGADPADTTGATNFNGVIDDMAVFPQALSAADLFAKYSAGVHGPPTAPIIIFPPQPRDASVGAIATFNVVAIGTAPLSYQWQLNGTNLTHNGHITGSTTANLAINNVQPGDVGNYRAIVTGAVAPAVTSSTAALTYFRPSRVDQRRGRFRR